MRKKSWRRITARGGRAKAMKADVSKQADIRRLFDSAVKEFGKVDVLVNNAGVYEFRPLAAVDENHFDRQFDVNVKGLYFAAQAAAQAFGDHGGSIVNISSVVSLSPRANGSVYSATKAATISMTKTAAVELGLRGIRCNVVAPGPVRTPMLPPGHVLNALAKNLSSLGRIADVEDLVGVYHFLASDQSKYMTGHTLIVDGGRLAGFRTEVLRRLSD